MNNTLTQKLQQISEVELPDSLHGRIMKQLLFLRFRTPFIVVTTLLSLNIIVSGWHAITRIIANDAHVIVATIIKDIEWNSASISQLWFITNDLVPVGSLITVAINLFLLIYVFRFVQKLNTATQKNNLT